MITLEQAQQSLVKEELAQKRIQFWTELAKAQVQITEPELDKTNPHFKTKYASLVAVRKAILVPLTSHGFSVIQGIVNIENKPYLSTRLTHKDGEYLEFHCPLLFSKNDMQGLGSAITYARRYSLAALVGVSGEEDDDGNTNAGLNKKPAPDPTNKPTQSSSKTLSDRQINRLFALSHNAGLDATRLKELSMSLFSKSSSKDLNLSEYNTLCDNLIRLAGEKPTP